MTTLITTSTTDSQMHNNIMAAGSRDRPPMLARTEVNELRAERIAKNANPLALVATAQPYQDPYYQTSKSHKSSAPTSKASLPTISHATTRHKDKEIAKPITPPSESASEEDSDPEQAKKDKEMQKNLALTCKVLQKALPNLSTTTHNFLNTRNKNMDTNSKIPRMTISPTQLWESETNDC
ncbi:hypothetical protein Tco_0221230 [Tanacetum coccineum]